MTRKDTVQMYRIWVKRGMNFLYQFSLRKWRSLRSAGEHAGSTRESGLDPQADPSFVMFPRLPIFAVTALG
jgi:hypothetical protein